MFLFVKLYFQLAWRVLLQWPTCVVSLSCSRHVFCRLWQTVTICLVNSCTVVQAYLGANEFLSSVILITPVFSCWFCCWCSWYVLYDHRHFIFFVDWRDCDTRLFGPLSVLCFWAREFVLFFVLAWSCLRYGQLQSNFWKFTTCILRTNSWYACRNSFVGWLITFNTWL